MGIQRLRLQWNRDSHGIGIHLAKILSRKTALKNSFCLLALLSASLVCTVPLTAQPTPPVDNSETSVTAEQQIEGIVTGRKKYSFTVSHDGKQYTVKLAEGAPVGLKMNKPWYDWKHDQVVVDAVAYPEGTSLHSPKRVAVKLPAKELYLISRFSDLDQMDEVMSANVKRINYYLVTPHDPGEHLPTDDQPFIAGALAIQKNQQVRLKVNDQSLRIRLGFRYATMNGFSIAQLEPNKTHVFLSGVSGENENEIIASRILFHPIEVTKTMAAK